MVAFPRVYALCRVTNTKAVPENILSFIHLSSITRSLVSVDMVEKLKEAQVVELKEAFCLFDTNQDGYVSCDELMLVMRRLGHHPTESEVEEMIADVDLDGNGVIDFAEFVSMIARRMTEVDTEREIRNAFQVNTNKIELIYD